MSFRVGGRRQRLVLLVGRVDQLRAETFRKELLVELLLVPAAEVFGASDVAAIELVLIASVDDAERSHLRASVKPSSDYWPCDTSRCSTQLTSQHFQITV